MSAELVERSRRENLTILGRFVIRLLPRTVYRQILREHDLAKAAQDRDGFVRIAQAQHFGEASAAPASEDDGGVCA